MEGGARGSTASRTMSVGSILIRVLRAAGAGVLTAIGIAIAYAIVNLYLTGHSISVPLVGGRPLHEWLGNVLVIIVPVAVAAYVFWRGDRY
jgi:hypothetical protein